MRKSRGLWLTMSKQSKTFAMRQHRGEWNVQQQRQATSTQDIRQQIRQNKQENSGKRFKAKTSHLTWLCMRPWLNLWLNSNSRWNRRTTVAKGTSWLLPKCCQITIFFTFYLCFDLLAVYLFDTLACILINCQLDDIFCCTKWRLISAQACWWSSKFLTLITISIHQRTSDRRTRLKVLRVD